MPARAGNSHNGTMQVYAGSRLEPFQPVPNQVLPKTPRGGAAETAFLCQSSEIVHGGKHHRRDGTLRNTRASAASVERSSGLCLRRATVIGFEDLVWPRCTACHRGYSAGRRCNTWLSSGSKGWNGPSHFPHGD